jgi:hypothetical protein
MIISPVIDVMEELLEQYRPCFSKPQFENFSTYTVGLITCEGKKNIQAINQTFMDAKNQSSLNRFLTKSSWNLESVQNKRLSLANEKLHGSKGSTGYVLLDDTINKKTGKHMEDAGYHYDSKEGKAVWGHDIVTTHYVNCDIEYPLRLSLYVKKETCEQKKVEFKTKIQLAVEQINAFTPPEGVRIMLGFDCWFFCRQIVDAAKARGWDWVTQADSNRIVHHKGHKTNVTELAKGLADERFKKVAVEGQDYVLCALKVWMPKIGDVRLVVSREDDGFHFYVSNRLDYSARQVLLAYKVRHCIDEFYRDVKQNLGLEAYQMRSSRGAIIHWHLVFCAHTLLTLLRKSAIEVDRLMAKALATLGDVCRWVKNQCSRKLVDWLFLKFKHKAKPENIYRILKI